VLQRRRRDLARMKRRARRLYAGAKCPEKYANHLTKCSCLFCGNPRKHFGTLPARDRRRLGGRRDQGKTQAEAPFPWHPTDRR